MSLDWNVRRDITEKTEQTVVYCVTDGQRASRQGKRRQ